MSRLAASLLRFLTSLIERVLFLAVLGLIAVCRLSLVAVIGSCSPVVEPGPLGVGASVVGAPRLYSRDVWVELLHGMWDLPRPGTKLYPLPWQGDSYPLDHHGSPSVYSLAKIFLQTRGRQRIRLGVGGGLSWEGPRGSCSVTMGNKNQVITRALMMCKAEVRKAIYRTVRR